MMLFPILNLDDQERIRHIIDCALCSAVYKDKDTTKEEVIDRIIMVLNSEANKQAQQRIEDYQNNNYTFEDSF